MRDPVKPLRGRYTSAAAAEPPSRSAGMVERTPEPGYEGEVMARPSIPDPPGFSELTKSEQIRYLQALWDRISDHPGELPAPESHLALAEERLAAYPSDPARARPAHDVLDRLYKRSE